MYIATLNGLISFQSRMNFHIIKLYILCCLQIMGSHNSSTNIWYKKKTKGVMTCPSANLPLAYVRPHRWLKKGKKCVMLPWWKMYSCSVIINVSMFQLTALLCLWQKNYMRLSLCHTFKQWCLAIICRADTPCPSEGPGATRMISHPKDRLAEKLWKRISGERWQYSKDLDMRSP